MIGEVNRQVPWTHSERLLQQEDFALLVESDRAPAATPPRPFGDAETAIARHAAAFVPDGATLEFGLGVLPDAVCAELGGRKRLKVHSRHHRRRRGGTDAAPASSPRSTAAC